MKCKEVMMHIPFDAMPNWKKNHDEKDIRIVRKVAIQKKIFTFFMISSLISCIILKFTISKTHHIAYIPLDVLQKFYHL